MLLELGRLLHWGPAFALSIISYISTVGFFATLLWWPPLEISGQLHLAVYLTHIPIILFSFLRALVLGPGFVPFKWQPKNSIDEAFLQYCHECEGFKPPRSHHCRKCKRCVLKMDHHCPWINTCCGHLNHVSFVTFLFYVPIGCAHAAMVLCCCAYRSIYRSPYHEIVAALYRPPINYSVPMFVASILGAGFAFAVIACVGFLFILQFYSVIRNKTGIEVYICEKADDLTRSEDSTFVYPYDLGVWNNFKCFLIGGNGYDWPIRPGASKYALTVEQKRQKEAKRERSLDFKVVRGYSGSCFPVTFGIRVLFNLPINDEPRMKVQIGDRIVVSRGKSLWFYGQKATTKNGKTLRERGWFPRECVELMDSKSMFDRLTKKDD